MGNSNDSPSFDITQIDLPHHLTETEKKTKALEYAEKMNCNFNGSQNSEGFDDAEACSICQRGNLGKYISLLFRSIFFLLIII